MTITAPPVPSQVTALYDALHGLGSFGPTGDPLVCAALLRAVSTVEGLALREVAAVDTYGTFVEVGQPSTVALVQTAVDCTQSVAGGTVRLARRLVPRLQLDRGHVLPLGRPRKKEGVTGSQAFVFRPQLGERFLRDVPHLVLLGLLTRWAWRLIVGHNR